MKRYQLRKRIQTRMGWHKRGEQGNGLNQCNGTVNFFPDRGGFAVVREEDLRLLAKRKPRRQAPVPPCLQKKQPRIIKRRHVRRIIRRKK